MFKENIKIIGRKNFKGRDRLIDFYIIMSCGREEYVFSKKYSNNSYDLCKGGIRINELIVTKSRDFGIMRIVEHMKRMVPYIKEEFQVV